MKRLALALAVVAMAAACKKAEEQPATESQMMQDSAGMMADSTKMMGDTGHMMGDSTKMMGDSAKM
jgi:hypothetical protein